MGAYASLLTQLALALLAALSSAALAYTGLLLLRIEKLLKSDNPAPLGLLLMSASEASAAGLVVASGEAAYLLYLFSSASFAMGGAILAWGRRRRGPRLAIALPLLYAGAGDLVASAIGIYSGLAARGPARTLLLLAGVSFAVRLAGLLLLPSWQGTVLLAAGESSRAVALTGLALVYAPIGGGAGGGQS